MKSLLIVPFCLVLGACQVCPEKPAVIEYRYVVRSAPADLYIIPPYPLLEITPTTQQSDVAEWILEMEERTRSLENQLVRLKEFFEAPVKPEEVK